MNIFADGRSKVHGKSTVFTPLETASDLLFNFAFHQDELVCTGKFVSDSDAFFTYDADEDPEIVRADQTNYQDYLETCSAVEDL